MIEPAIMRPTSGYIVTASGQLVYPLDPRPEQIHLVDIAAHLSKQARWTGANTGDQVYTIAQHAILVSLAVEEAGAGFMAALDGLHHDDSEAYLSDISRPVKYDKSAPEFGNIYRRNEHRLMRAIYEKFDIPFIGDEHHPAVKDADNRMLITEARDIMPEPLDSYEVYEFSIKDAYKWRISYVFSHKEARELYLDRHESLVSRIAEEKAA